MIPYFSLTDDLPQFEEQYVEAFRRVLRSGRIMLGPEVEAFEREFAAWCGARYAVGVGNGTEAITCALMALGIGAGDEVITVAHTAVPTVSAVIATGAQPVLVDVEPSFYTLDPEKIEAAITPRTRAILPVHLYGQPAAVDRIAGIADRHGLHLVEDIAQGHGARLGGEPVGAFGVISCYSFYPTKNLGAWGDAGAVTTDDPELDERLRRIRNLGQANRYHHVEHGLNCRLDEIHAALLRIKLPHLDESIARRRALAARYDERFAALPGLAPAVRPGATHSYHLYVIRSPRRDALQAHLNGLGIGTLIHYPIPVHRQLGYRDRVRVSGSLEVTELLVGEILSLPLYPTMPAEHVDAVADAVIDFHQRGQA